MDSLFDLKSLREKGFDSGDILANDVKIYEKFIQYIARTVKHDETTINLDFLTGLSAYTEEPINNFQRGESSTGKTYIAIQSLRSFPQDDVWLLGGLSPTALVHDRGVLTAKDGTPIMKMDKPGKDATPEEKEAYRQYKEDLRDARYIVKLNGKILVFLEAPHLETFHKLRPILSHDAYEISYKFTDKELESRHVVLRGWPAAIFCTTEEGFLQDLATRSFTDSPSVSEEKFQDANKLTGSKAAIPWRYEDNGDFFLLRSYVETFKKTAKDFRAILPFGEQFGAKFPSKMPRSMRDFTHLKGLIQVHALFHYAQRPILIRELEGKQQTYVLATKTDYEVIMRLWEKVKESTESSAARQVIKFFHDIVEPLAKEKATFTVRELTDRWNETFSDRKSSDSIRNYVHFCCQINWMSKDENPENKRELLLQVVKTKTEENRFEPQNDLSAFFTLEHFKTWLNAANSITEKNHVFLRESFNSTDEATPEAVFDKFYCSGTLLSSVIDSSPTEPPLPKQTEKKTEQTEIGNLLSRVEKLERLTGKFEDKCVVCGFSGPMDYQATFHDQTWALVCGSCGIKLCERLNEA